MDVPVQVGHTTEDEITEVRQEEIEKTVAQNRKTGDHIEAKGLTGSHMMLTEEGQEIVIERSENIEMNTGTVVIVATRDRIPENMNTHGNAETIALDIRLNAGFGTQMDLAKKRSRKII